MAVRKATLPSTAATHRASGTRDCSGEGRQGKPWWLYWERGSGQREEQPWKGTVHDAVIKRRVSHITYHILGQLKGTALAQALATQAFALTVPSDERRCSTGAGILPL